MNTPDSLWLESLLSEESQVWVRNVRTKIEKAPIGWPVTINDSELDNSYVCSPYTAFVSYAREELGKLPSAIARLLPRLLISLLDRVLIWAEINRTINVNNWLLSTNLYDGEINVKLTLDDILLRYPSHSIVFRSLNEHTNQRLMKELLALGCDLMPTRQVYIFDRTLCEFGDKINSVRDASLLDDGLFTIVQSSELKDFDFERLEALYNLLYLEKYSVHNPQFTAKFFKFCAGNQIMNFYALKDSDGTIQGVVGYFVRAGVMTTPIIGYNTKLAQTLALYRRLIALVLRDAQNQNVILNLSSGASHFKRLRGGIPFIEYSAVYGRHLSFHRRLVLGFLRLALTYVGVPIIRRFKL